LRLSLAVARLRSISSRKIRTKDRRASTQFTPYYCKGKKGSTVKRGKYFTHYRRERSLLKELSEAKPNVIRHSPSLKDDSDRRILRFIYYRIIPKLLKTLLLEEDQSILYQLEYEYYHLLNLGRVSSGKATRVNRLKCIYLDQTYECKRMIDLVVSRKLGLLSDL